MKQHISEKQYYSSKEIRRKLEDIGLLKYQQVTIGKMIEILWNQKAPLTYRLVFNGTDEKDVDMERLCDELWEEIKRAI